MNIRHHAPTRFRNERCFGRTYDRAERSHSTFGRYAVILFAFLVAGPAVFGADNILANPGMEEASGNTVAVWRPWAYFHEKAVFERIAGNAHAGGFSASISCPSEDDARYIQTANVKPNTTYRISCWIKTENIGTGAVGANISVERTPYASRDIRGTNGRWENVSLYVRTDESVHALNICLGIGGYGSTNTGTAWFDDARMEEKSPDSASEPVFPIGATEERHDEGASRSADSGFRIPELFAGMSLLLILCAAIGILLTLGTLFLFARNSKLFTTAYGAVVDFFTHIFIPPAGEHKGLRRFTGSPWTRPLFFLLAFLVLGVPFVWDMGRSLATEPIHGAENHYVALAQSILQGRLDITQPYHDTAHHDGKIWVIYPPFPVLFLLPFVAIFGLATKVTYIGIALAIWSAILLWRILKRVETDKGARPWMIFAFIFGTGYWLCLRNSLGVCWYAHVASVFGLLLALDESLGKSRGLLVGLYLGAAFLSRQFTIFFFPFLIAAIWTNAARKDLKGKLLHFFGFGAGLTACVAVYLLFNWARFGSPLDTGYAYLELGGFLDDKVKRYGLFSLHHVPLNFVYMFFQGFHINYGDAPILATDVHMYWPLDPFGTSIIAASPFVFFAFAAKWKRPLIVTMWISVAIVLFAELLYYNNGWVQYNAQRFAVDFLPAFMILVALGIRNVPAKYWKPLVVYAVFFNALTMLIIPKAG
jgi:hypothetical protein